MELASKITGELVKVAAAEDRPGHLADRDRLTPRVSLVKAAIEDSPGHLLQFNIIQAYRALVISIHPSEQSDDGGFS